ncbi:hypothetical protein GCM10028813_35740 [Ramlibacter alkalitolerans]
MIRAAILAGMEVPGARCGLRRLAVTKEPQRSSERSEALGFAACGAHHQSANTETTLS